MQQKQPQRFNPFRGLNVRNGIDEQVRAAIKRTGLSRAAWAEQAGHAIGTVNSLARGRIAGTRGKARAVLVSLGIEPPARGTSRKAVTGMNAELDAERVEQAKYLRSYYERNKDKLRAYAKQYYSANRSRARESNRLYVRARRGDTPRPTKWLADLAVRFPGAFRFLCESAGGKKVFIPTIKKRAA